MADVEVVPGGTFYYSLHINIAENRFKDFQYHINFPRSGFSTPAEPNTTVHPDWAGSITPGPIFASNYGKVLGESDGNGYLPGGDRIIGSVAVKVADDMPLGEYEVYLDHFSFIFDGGSGDHDFTEKFAFKVKVVDVLTVVLDENSTEAPTAINGVNARVLRTINANEWGTICLPFAMSNEQVTAAFGSDVQLCNFTGHDYEEASNGDITAITMNFEPVLPAVIEANHPYLIKVSSPVTEFEVNNVDIVPEDEPCVEFDNGKSGNRRVVFSGFYGTYQAQTVVPEFALFLSGGNFYYSKGLTKMKAFRAYFETQEILTKVENGSAGAKIGLVINDGETTSLNEELRMKSEEFGEGWYTLDGMKLNGEPKKKGIYIKDGRKVVVK